jgi:pimeloyl-ACP methyl ester carboxylesterase
MSASGGATMPYATNQGIRVHYQTEGSGPPLVMQHGSSTSGEDWRDFGYAEVLRRDYRLILVDARGHGASDKPHDRAAYDLALRAGDIAAVLDDLQLRDAHYLGYSMGGWIGYGLAKFAPQRCRSLMLGGAHPYAESMQAIRSLVPKDAEAFLAVAGQTWGSFLTPSLRARILATDLEALAALLQDRTSLAEVIPTMRMPCLLFAGDQDPRHAQVQECATQLADATFVSVPGCNHVAAYARSDLVLPHVSRFLARVR